MEPTPNPDAQTRFAMQQNIEGRVEVLQTEFENHAKQVAQFMERQERINTDLFSLIRSQGDVMVDKLSRVGADMHTKFDAFQNTLHGRGKITAPMVAVAVSCLTMLGGIVHWYVSDQIRLMDTQIRHHVESSASVVGRLNTDNATTNTNVRELQTKLDTERLENARNEARIDERVKILQEHLAELRAQARDSRVPTHTSSPP